MMILFFRLNISPFFLSFAAGLLFVFSAVSCQRQPRPVNFLRITLDTQRADHISAYDPANSSTPHIDLLAREGILFKNAYSLIPITLPSHASLFFSEAPCRIKNYNNGQKIVAKKSRLSLANLFQKKGFTTAAFVSLGILNSSFGLYQGFDVYEDGFAADRWYLSAGEVNARVFPWLEQNRDRSFFLWIHYSDPHEPYAPPYMPSDLKLFLNDRPVYETSLQKYALNEVTLDLGPGKNRLRWELENEFDTDPDHFLGRLDRMAFDPSAAGQLKIDFGPGWFIRGTDNISFFKSPSIIEIDNRADLKQARLIFRGKPILPAKAPA